MKDIKTKGFSLVELLIIVSIISIMSSTTVVGLGRMKQALQFRESVAFLSDIVRAQELKVLRGDFEKVVIRFLENYLVIEEYPPESTLELAMFDCLARTKGEVDYGVTLGKNEGVLVQKGSDRVIQTRNLKKGVFDCQTDFSQSEELEISYQLTRLDEFSPIIKFIHFNLKREASDSLRGAINNPIYIGVGSGSRIEMFAPYSKKLVYNHRGELKPSGSIIEVKDRSGEFTEKLTL